MPDIDEALIHGAAGELRYRLVQQLDDYQVKQLMLSRDQALIAIGHVNATIEHLGGTSNLP